MRERRKQTRNFKYRMYRSKIELRNKLMVATDAVFTYFGLFIFLCLLVLTLPLLILDRFLSGDR